MPDIYVLAAAKCEELSEGGGRHWTLTTTDANAHTITSGDLVIFGSLVGVALIDFDTATESVVIDTQGGHALSVKATVNGGGNEALAVGDWVFYDDTDDEINADYAGIPIGQLLEGVTSGATATVAVKLQPNPLADRRVRAWLAGLS